MQEGFPLHSQPSEVAHVVCDPAQPPLSALITGQRSQSELINLWTFSSWLQLPSRLPVSRTYWMWTKENKCVCACVCTMIIRVVAAFNVIRKCQWRSTDDTESCSMELCRLWEENCVVSSTEANICHVISSFTLMGDFMLQQEFSKTCLTPLLGNKLWKHDSSLLPLTGWLHKHCWCLLWTNVDHFLFLDVNFSLHAELLFGVRYPCVNLFGLNILDDHLYVKKTHHNFKLIRFS